MKKICKILVPSILALLLSVAPTAAVFADEANPAFSEPAVIANIAETDLTEDPTEETSQEDAADTGQTVSDDANYNHVWPTPPEIGAESALIVEMSTSSVLYEKEADTQRYPASTTKILTALVAIENSELDETVTFSENAVNLEEAATNIKAVPGEKMPMIDVLHGLMIASGNDCAVAIAEHVAGSVEAFADMMNERAAEIGCTGSHFVNPHGLFDKDHYTTARDLALIAQEAYKNTTFLEIISKDVYYAEPTNKDENQKKFTNWDLLMDPESDYYNPDVIGGKTGYLNESGRCLVTYAERDGFMVIVVQLKAGYTEIFNEATKLLNYSFKHFALKNVSSVERRFSTPVSNAKVSLDPSAQILVLKKIPFEQLESTLCFAEDLELERRADLQAVAEEVPGRSIYAVIDYSYAGHELGAVNVYLNPQLTIAPAAFTEIIYFSPLYLVIFVLLVLVILLVVYRQKKPARSAAGQKPRRPSDERNRTYRR